MFSKKLLTNLLSFTFLVGVSFSSTGCVIINSQFNIDDYGGEAISDDSFETITSKYNDLFEANPYTGGECTIKFVHWDGDGQAIEMSVLNTMLRGFNLRYPNIHVKLTILSDYEKAYSTILTGSDIADVFLMPDGDVMPWAPLNVAEDLGDYVENSNIVTLDEMYPSSIIRYKYDYSLGRCTDNGTLIALPKDIGPMVMYYNKAAFRKAGLPYPNNTEIMSLDDAFVMWDQLKQTNSKGQVIMYGVGGLSIEGLVWSSGGDFLNESRTAFPAAGTATREGLHKGYEYMQRSYCDMGDGKPCQVQPPASWTSGSDAAKLFSNQMLACFVGLKSRVAQFRKLNFDWNVCPVPANTINPTANAWSGSVGYSLYKGSRHKEAAWKLIEYIASKEGQELMSATGFQIPVYPALAEQPDYIERESNNKPANFTCFLQAAELQPIGLWSYHRNQLWLQEALNLDSEKLFADDPSERLTVDQFFALTEPHVNQKLNQ